MGRTVGKDYKPGCIMKDLDFKRRFVLGPAKRETFFNQLEKDTLVGTDTFLFHVLLSAVPGSAKEHGLQLARRGASHHMGRRLLF